MLQQLFAPSVKTARISTIARNTESSKRMVMDDQDGANDEELLHTQPEGQDTHLRDTETSTDEEEHEIEINPSAELQRRIEEFTALPAHPELSSEHRAIAVTPRSRSICETFGVRVTSSTDKKSCFFRCLTGTCYRQNTLIRTSISSTYQATQHIKTVHKTTALRTESKQKNTANIQKLLDVSGPDFLEDPARFFAVNVSSFQIQFNIPFDAFKSKAWKIVAKRLPCPGGSGLPPINLRKVLIEHYCTIKDKITSHFAQARAAFHIPYLSLNLDLITGKVNQKKYIGLRLSFTLQGHMHSYNIAVREFSPSSSERAKDQASVILIKWLKGITKEFGIVPTRDILTSASDSGSDVKRSLEVVFKTWREWCLAHLTNLCLVDAFGTNVNATACKNKQACATFKVLRKFIETLNKSGRFKAIFDEQVLEVFGTIYKVKNSPQHRWSSVEESIVGILVAWKQLKDAAGLAGVLFPLTGYRQVLIEWRSIIHEPRAIQKLCQSMKTFVVIDVYIRMAHMYMNLLDISKPLEIHDPGPLSLNNHSNGVVSPSVYLSADELDPSSTQVRSILRTAYCKRYYNRYHPMNALLKPTDFYGLPNPKRSFSGAVRGDFRFSYLFDIQGVFYPGLRDCCLIKTLIDATDVRIDELPDGWTLAKMRESFFSMVKTFIWCSIRLLAEQVALTSVMEDERRNGGGDGQVVKRRKVDSVVVRGSSLALLAALTGKALPNAATEADDQTASEQDPKRIVENEILYYHAIEAASFPETHDLLTWWDAKPQHSHMPCLSEVAAAFKGNKMGSGGLECDFGGLADVLQPKRSSLGAGFVEAFMMVKLNKSMIGSRPSDIRKLPNDKWKEFIPCRPDMEEEVESDDEKVDIIDSD